MKALLELIFPSSIRKKVQIARKSTYYGDGLITEHNSDFLKDPLFLESYRLGKATGSWGKSDLEWRAYVACWAAEKGKRLGGDFVECGVNRGGLARTVMHYIRFNDMPCSKFYLLDTFCGFTNESGYLPAGPNLDDYSECFEAVAETFKGINNVIIIKGQVPRTLSQVVSERVCYLSLDMNCADPEIAAAEFFWEKLVSGAVILLDDYGYSEAYRRQKLAFDRFAQLRGVQVLLLPTGQGLIIKP
jgi:O-methyltransferase